MMQKHLLLLLLSSSFLCNAQTIQGTVVTDSIYSRHLENQMGESPTRAVSVYLPPGYEESNLNYPVIYFLHGFTGDNTILS
jgi:S-formylglutathione hydrolase FrmB